MKKQAIALAALLCAAAAQAQVYGTVAGGASHINADCVGATSCDKTGTGIKLVGGYGFGNGFSLEAGYMTFGKVAASNSSSSLTLKPTAFTFGGAYALPMGSDWGLNVRLGVAQVKTKVNATLGSASGSDSESKANVYAGLGLTYAVSKDVKLELGIDSTTAHYAGESGSVRLLSLGATFAF